MNAIDDKEAERDWDGLWNEQKDSVATRAGLIRSSAFTRSLPYWRGLPENWHEPLRTLFKSDREKRKADEAARSAETERQERAELARLLAKYGAAQETPAAPRGKPCTCSDVTASACGLEQGFGKLGELWYCRRLFGESV